MVDVDHLMDDLVSFAQTLTCASRVGDVLHDLAAHVTEALGVTGAGITLVDGERVRFVTSVLETIDELERVQESVQSGPCVDAVRTGRPVRVPDLTTSPVAIRWPEYAAAARDAGIRAVSGFPMCTQNRVLGAINVYDVERNDWQEQDLRAAGIFSAMASSYLMHSSATQQQQQLAEQLQQALETRVIIEQAKGVLAGTWGCSVDAAFKALRAHARRHNARIHDAAHAVVHLGLRPEH